MPPGFDESRPRIAKLTKDEASDRIRRFEQSLSGLLRSVSPNDFVPAAAARLRGAVLDRSQFGTYPPHVMVHAIEACCAYGRHDESFLVPEAYFRRIIQAVVAFDDPVLTAMITPDSDLFEFLHYMHRTQLDKQRGMWWMPIGRMTWLLGSPGSMPACDSDFQRRFGMSLRQWLQLAFVVEVATMGEKSKFTYEYAEQCSALGVPDEVTQRFLREISRTPTEIGQAYRQIREGGNGSPARSPLTWFQHKPQISRTPLIRFPRGYVAPVEAYVVGLFGDSLFRRLVAEKSEPIRRELGKRFEQYSSELFSHYLPAARIVASTALRVRDGKSSDFVIEFPDCLLLVECKAVIFDRDVVTRKAVLTSSAVDKLIDGYEQLILTAKRIQAGEYGHLGLDSGKPRYGVVATLGEIPMANHAAVWAHAKDTLEKRGISGAIVPDLFSASLQAFHGLTIEHFILCLANDLGNVPQMFRERAEGSPLSMVDWEGELSEKLQPGKPHDMSFWKNPAETLLNELVPAKSAGD